jgi:hypothetical protein
MTYYLLYQIDKKTDFNDLTTIRTALMRRLQRGYYRIYHYPLPSSLPFFLSSVLHPHYATLHLSSISIFQVIIKNSSNSSNSSNDTTKMTVITSYSLTPLTLRSIIDYSSLTPLRSVRKEYQQ